MMNEAEDLQAAAMTQSDKDAVKNMEQLAKMLDKLAKEGSRIVKFSGDVDDKEFDKFRSLSQHAEVLIDEVRSTDLFQDLF